MSFGNSFGNDLPPFMKQPLMCEPKLVITRQPKKFGYRFRYSSEGQTHGGIPGEPDKPNDRNKVYPTIKLVNHNGPARIVLTLVSANKDQKCLHPHSLIVDKSLTDGYHVFELSANSKETELKSVAIQHVVKDKLTQTLCRRILATRFINGFGWNSGLNSGLDKDVFDIEYYKQRLKDANDPKKQCDDRPTAQAVAAGDIKDLEREALDLSKVLQMNQVRLCFQAFLRGPTGKFTEFLEPVYSDVIFDGKTKQGAMLKIVRISNVASSVEGGEEVWIVADKINAEDIEVRFYHERAQSWDQSTDDWEDFGVFNKTDVYKQCVIIFKTPPYRDQNICQPQKVNVQLRRKKDQTCHSEPVEFKYTPRNIDRYGIGEKRKKTMDGRGFAFLSGPSSSKSRYDSETVNLPIQELSHADILKNVPPHNFTNLTTTTEASNLSQQQQPFIMNSTNYNYSIKSEPMNTDATSNQQQLPGSSSQQQASLTDPDNFYMFSSIFQQQQQQQQQQQEVTAQPQQQMGSLNSFIQNLLADDNLPIGISDATESQQQDGLTPSIFETLTNHMSPEEYNDVINMNSQP